MPSPAFLPLPLLYFFSMYFPDKYHHMTQIYSNANWKCPTVSPTLEKEELCEEEWLSCEDVRHSRCVHSGGQFPHTLKAGSRSY